MAVKIERDDNIDLNKESDNINKKQLTQSDNSDEANDAQLQNQIKNKIVKFTKDNRTMNDALFKVTLETIYYDIFKKKLTYRNIPDDIELQINIKKIAEDYSYVKGYNILEYYSHKNKVLEGESLITVTALFYTTLNKFIKRLNMK